MTNSEIEHELRGALPAVLEKGQSIVKNAASKLTSKEAEVFWEQTPWLPPTQVRIHISQDLIAVVLLRDPTQPNVAVQQVLFETDLERPRSLEDMVEDIVKGTGEQLKRNGYRPFIAVYPWDTKAPGLVKKVCEWVARLAESNVAGFLRSDTIRSTREDTKSLSSELAKLPDRETSKRLLSLARRVEEGLQRIEGYDKEMSGFRKLIGKTKAFQEWRVLVEDVESLKTQHVSRDRFDSEVKRLDQRIDDLKGIRLFSTRTLLEVILVVVTAVATIVAALLATGYLPILFHP